MSALAGLASIKKKTGNECVGGEVPILDGSAGPFVFLLRRRASKNSGRKKSHPHLEAVESRRRQLARFEPHNGSDRIHIDLTIRYSSIRRNRCVDSRRLICKGSQTRAHFVFRRRWNGSWTGCARRLAR